jgi:hypothetical protein
MARPRLQTPGARGPDGPERVAKARVRNFNDYESVLNQPLNPCITCVTRRESA